MKPSQFKMISGLSLVSVLLLGACGSASVRRQDERGGVLVLHGEEGPAMKDANEKMRNHCLPRTYRVVKREEVTVGHEQYSVQDTAYQEKNRGVAVAAAKRTRKGAKAAVAAETDQHGAEQTTTVSGTREVRETQLTYKCVRP